MHTVQAALGNTIICTHTVSLQLPLKQFAMLLSRAKATTCSGCRWCMCKPSDSRGSLILQVFVVFLPVLCGQSHLIRKNQLNNRHTVLPVHCDFIAGNMCMVWTYRQQQGRVRCIINFKQMMCINYVCIIRRQWACTCTTHTCTHIHTHTHIHTYCACIHTQRYLDSMYQPQVSTSA